MCTVLLPPGGNPIAANKYIISSEYLDIRRSDIRRSRYQNVGISEGPAIRKSGYQKVQISECRDIRRSSYQKIWISESPDIRMSGYQKVQLSENLDIRKSRYQKFGYKEVKIPECRDIRSSGQKLQVSEGLDIRQSRYKNIWIAEGPNFWKTNWHEKLYRSSFVRLLKGTFVETSISI